MSFDRSVSCIKIAIFIGLLWQFPFVSMTLADNPRTADNNTAAKHNTDPPKLLYKLNLSDPAADYSRQETGTLEAHQNGQQVHIAGEFYLEFPDTNMEMHVSYTADEQGYHAPYVIRIVPFEIAIKLSVAGLKAAAG